MTGFEVLLPALGNIYLVVALAGMCLALWRGKTLARKLAWATGVFALFAAPMAPDLYRGLEYRYRLGKAQALFAERCKKAGEFIHRTVDDVEGVYLLKIRPNAINYGDQFKLDDPYGRDLGGDGYIESLLRGSYEAGHSGTPIAGAPPPPKGYLYVEAVDPNDGVRYRYTGRMEEPWQTNKSFSKGYWRFAMDKAPAPAAAPRYAVTYDDISTREERELWIAGSSLKVIDLQTKEVIAERIGYMVDVFQGSRAGGRSPWLFAADHACPSFQRNPLRPPGHGSAAQAGQTQYFVEKVLRPKLTQGK